MVRKMGLLFEEKVPGKTSSIPPAKPVLRGMVASMLPWRGIRTRVYGPGQGSTNLSHRDQIMLRFEKWLDEVLTEEGPPEGIDGELLSELKDEEPSAFKGGLSGRQDHYSTWSAITALTQEVKLQGRAFRDLGNELKSLAGLSTSMEKLAQSHRDAVADARSMAERANEVLTARRDELGNEAMARARKEIIEVLADIREGMVIGLGSVEESMKNLVGTERPNWLRRIFARKDLDMERVLGIISSLKKGYSLSLGRIEEALGEFGVTAIRCEGEPFDPGRMTAVEIEERSDVPDGTVLEVFRTGYASESEIIRPAQVKVARKPAGRSGGELR